MSHDPCEPGNAQFRQKIFSMVRYRRRVRRRASVKCRLRRGYRRTRRATKFSRVRRTRKGYRRYGRRRRFVRRRKLNKKCLRTSKNVQKKRKLKYSVNLNGTTPVEFPTSAELHAAGYNINMVTLKNFYGSINVRNVYNLIYDQVNNVGRLQGLPDVFSGINFGTFMFLDDVFGFRVMTDCLTKDSFGKRCNFEPGYLGTSPASSKLQSEDTSIRRRTIEYLLKYNYVRIAKIRYRFVRRKKMDNPTLWQKYIKSSTLDDVPGPLFGDYSVIPASDGAYIVTQQARKTSYETGDSEYTRADELFFYVCDGFQMSGRDFLRSLQRGVNDHDWAYAGAVDSNVNIDERYIRLFTSMTETNGQFKWQKFSTKLKSFVIERQKSFDDYDSHELSNDSKPAEGAYNLTGIYPSCTWVQASSKYDWIGNAPRLTDGINHASSMSLRSLCNSSVPIDTDAKAILPVKRSFMASTVIFSPFDMAMLNTFYDVTAECVLEFAGKRYSIFEFFP